MVRILAELRQQHRHQQIADDTAHLPTLSPDDVSPCSRRWGGEQLLDLARHLANLALQCGGVTKAKGVSIGMGWMRGQWLAAQRASPSWAEACCNGHWLPGGPLRPHERPDGVLISLHRSAAIDPFAPRFGARRATPRLPTRARRSHLRDGAHRGSDTTPPRAPPVRLAHRPG